MPPALHFARQGLRLTDEVTLYTNGNETLVSNLSDALDHPKVPRMKIDPRRIKKLQKGLNRSEVIIYFEDGTTKVEGFIGHKPKFQLRGLLHEQIGLEITPQGTVKVTPPFNQTSIPGVFACGDMISPMQTVTQALASGSAAGAGAAVQLQADQLGQKPIF